MTKIYYNKEWWRQHVRMVTPEATKHACKIRSVAIFLQNNPTTSSCYTSDMKEYFKNFEQKCLQGYFEELSDVSMFIHRGVDKRMFTKK